MFIFSLYLQNGGNFEVFLMISRGVEPSFDFIKQIILRWIDCIYLSQLFVPWEKTWLLAWIITRNVVSLIEQ